MSTTVGCIVLAAGSSKRFGSDKRRHLLPNGLTLLEQTLTTLQQVFDRRVLVLRPGDTDLAARFASDWTIVTAADAALGMGHSLAAAIHATAQWSGAVIALADMPWINKQTLSAIGQALKPDNIVVPFYKGQRGNPVAIGSDYFGRLAALQGDSGARQLMQEFGDRIIQLNVDDAGILQDLDALP